MDILLRLSLDLARPGAWGSVAEDGASDATRKGLIEGTVLRTISGFYDVETQRGRRTAALRAGLRHETGAGRSESRGRVRSRGAALEPVVVGDRVLLRPGAASGGRDWIEQVLPRRGTLTRRAAGERRPVAQTLVANVDQALVVFAMRDPQPRLGLADRFLVAAEAQDLPAVLCLNKIDLPADEQTLAGFAELESAGYPLIAVSARTGEGLALLGQRLAGRTTVVVGPSGVGKSSLLNTLEPDLSLSTGEVNAAIGKGRHTTRFAQLLPLSRGGYVVDTPGLREFALWEVDPEDLDDYFPEFEPYLGQCRFSDCDHTQREGCAVFAAVQCRAVPARRYESYVKLYLEAQAEQAASGVRRPV